MPLNLTNDFLDFNHLRRVGQETEKSGAERKTLYSIPMYIKTMSTIAEEMLFYVAVVLGFVCPKPFSIHSICA